jgi:hypothetical protein
VPGPVVQVVGARQLRATMKRAGDDLGDLVDVHGEISRLVVASTRAPRRSGRLAGTVRGSGTKTVATVRAGRSSVPYAGPIHYGWPARHIAPSPFLTDAAHGTEPAWRAMYLDAVEKILARVKGA